MAEVGNTIRHAVDAFKNFVEDRTGRQKDDLAYPSYLVYYYLNMYNNRILYETRKQEGIFDYDESIAETITCVSLIELDIVECPCAPAKGCSFFKSVFPIPKMIGDGLPITVNTVDSGTTFDHVRWQNFHAKVNSRSQSDREGFYYTMKTIDKDLHLYIYRSCCFDSLNAVSITGVFADPLEVSCFPVCSETPIPLCSPLDIKFIVDKEIESLVFEATYRAISMMKSLGAGADIINNDVDNSTSEAPIE